MKEMVSIPSNGSIQFLQYSFQGKRYGDCSLNPLKRVNSTLTGTASRRSRIIAISSLNPLKRVNSILTDITLSCQYPGFLESQSPQTGQFNSYMISGRSIWDMKFETVSIPSNGSIQFLRFLCYRN